MCYSVSWLEGKKLDNTDGRKLHIISGVCSSQIILNMQRISTFYGKKYAQDKRTHESNGQLKNP